MTTLFQHRHYVAIARIIAALPDQAQRKAVAVHFGVELQGTNPNFDTGRFIDAAIGAPSNHRDR